MRVVIPLAGVALACVLWSLLLTSVGGSPLKALQMLATSMFGSTWGVRETLVKAAPLALCASGIALAASMNLWNIGAEGQIYVGALAGSWVALSFPDLPAWLMMPGLLLAGGLAGAAWCGACGLLKARLGVSEILTTLMLNYVAVLWVGHMVHGPWKGEDNFPYSAYFAKAAWLPNLGVERLHVGVLIALVLVGGLYLVQRWSVWGFEIRTAGESWATAAYAGVPVSRRVVAVMALAGALAGLAGAIEVSGLHHRLQPAVSPGYGYTAIIVCGLARKRLLGCLVVAFLFAGLLVAGEEMQVVMRLPGAAVQVLQAMVLLAVLGGDLLVTHRPVWRRGADAPR